MEVRPGYQQTDLGHIPIEWEILPFKDVFDITAGGDVNKNLSSNEQDQTHCYPIYSNAVTDRGLYGFCSYADHPAGSITVTARGALGVANYRDHKYTAIGRVLVLKPKRDVAGRYFAEIINSLIRFAVESTGVPQLTAPQIGGYLVVVPPLLEQGVIASALNDMDALLAGLDRLIIKKRNLKQASMQQLLTGQTRLPGFIGEWEVKRLGDHVSFLKNGVYSRAELTTNSAIKYLHYGDIHASVTVTLDPSEMPGLSEHRARLLDRLANGDLIFVDASEDLDGVGKSVEIVGAADVQMVAGLHTIAARFDSAVLADGFKSYLQFCPSFRQHLKRLAAGTKVYATNRSHIASVEMPLPNTDEQIAIATILSDMDAELMALEARRDKTRALKQGMMQELLTGRTRLV